MKNLKYPQTYCDKHKIQESGYILCSHLNSGLTESISEIIEPSNDDLGQILCDKDHTDDKNGVLLCKCCGEIFIMSLDFKTVKKNSCF